MKTKLIDLLGLTNMANDIRDWVNAHFQRKVDGKGLSTNDYTEADKASVASAYHKPQDGIPKTDLASDVRTSLGKADTALQQQDISGKQDKIDADNKLSADLVQDGSTNKVVTSSEKSVWNGKQDAIADLEDIRRGAAKGDTALQSYTETDPTVPSWAKQSTKPSYDYSEIGNTPNLSGFITKSVNDLTNYYLKSETYTKDEVAALIGAIQQFHYEIYATLPASGENNVLYLIGPTGSGSDKYEEYVYSNNTFTKIGDTSIDLSGYVTTSALNTALASYTPTSNLATVATSGSYNDLTNKPTIPTVPVQDVTVGGASVVNNGTAVIPQEVFVAIYGTTTIAEIDAAVSGNKSVVCFYQGYQYVLSFKATDDSYYFACPLTSANYWLRILGSNDTWSKGTAVMEVTGNKVSTISGNETNTTKYPNTKAVADYVEPKLQYKSTLSNGNIVLEDGAGVERVFMPAIPSGDPMHYMYVNAGAEYNNTGTDITKTAPWGEQVIHLAGYWYLNGLGDLTNEDMREVWEMSNALQVEVSGAIMHFDFKYCNARTIFPNYCAQGGGSGTGAYNRFRNAEYLEVIDRFNKADNNFFISSGISGYRVFYNCKRLKYICATINISSFSCTNIQQMFYNCTELLSVHIKGLGKVSNANALTLDLSVSSKLLLESVVFAVENADSTYASTITLHADALARCTADTTEYEYNSNTYTGIVALANAKNITLAS